MLGLGNWAGNDLDRSIKHAGLVGQCLFIRNGHWRVDLSAPSPALDYSVLEEPEL